MNRSARISKCGLYRWTLTRQWDERPTLLVVMFNPSRADNEVDDPTISTLCRRASVWGYGGIVVVNLIPLRTSAPAAAVHMVETWDLRRAWDERDALQENLAVIVTEVKRAGAILLAYGALGARTDGWTEQVVSEIQVAAWREHSPSTPLYCMGRTLSGYPIHPLARGKWRVPNDAPLQVWSELNATTPRHATSTTTEK